MNILIVFLQYFLLAGIVIFSANKASKYVDEIDKKTSVSGALLGGVVLAGITSLPELITTISSTTFLGKPGLAFGNIFGSNIFNLVIIAAMDLFFIKREIFNKSDHRANSKTNKIVIILYTIILIPLMIDMFIVDVSIPLITAVTPLSIISLIILVLYILNIKNLIDGDDDEEEREVTKTTVKQDLVGLLIWSVVLVAAALLISHVTGEISDILNLNASLAGALFLGIATSLPEFTAVYTLIKRNNNQAAISNIVGSNVFNLVILSFVDVITLTNIYSGLTSDASLQINVATLIILGLINAIILFFIFGRKDKDRSKFSYIFPSVLILVNYVIYLLISFGVFDNIINKI